MSVREILRPILLPIRLRIPRRLPPQMPRLILRSSVVVSLLLTMVACMPVYDREGDYLPLRTSSETDEAARTIQVGDVDPSPDQAEVIRTPRPPYEDDKAGGEDEPITVSLPRKKVKVNFRNMPLPDFINEVFGLQLGLSYTMDPGLSASSDLVTLSVSEPLAAEDLYRTARTVLADYGVAMIPQDNLLRFVFDRDAASDVPLIISGAALPDVPASHRPVFSFVILDVVSNNQAARWLLNIFGSRVTIQEDPERNALVLRGPLAIVREAAEVLDSIDQPVMRGRHSASFRPVFLSVSDLTKDMVSILRSEGYAVAERPPYGSIIILPLGWVLLQMFRT